MRLQPSYWFESHLLPIEPITLLAETGSDRRADMAIKERERRASTRFAIGREIRYKLLNRKGGAETGEGTVINMSSTGILFTTDRVLLPGRAVEVAVNWPVQLNDACPLKLVARGRVVRFEAGRAAIEFQHYEFRTAGSKNFAARLV